MPKIAVTGKGGVGKTTLTALLAHVYAERGRTVLAIDADPAASLSYALGYSPEAADAIVPIAEMDELIFERTGAKPGTSGGFFSLSPRVDDIPDRFSAELDGIRLLRLGTIKQGGSGCICPESSLLRNLVAHLMVARDEVVIMDMEAGIEHLGRGTAQAVDAFLIVVEPSRRSLATAAQIQRLAGEVGIKRCYLVGNKVRENDRAFIEANRGDLPIAGYLPVDEQVDEADRAGISVYSGAVGLRKSAQAIADFIDQESENSA